MGAAATTLLPWWERVVSLVSVWLPRVESRGGIPNVHDGPETVFILFGGAARGAAQAGVLTVLLEHGITPDLIIGISAGAWNGSYLALDPTVERCLELEALWRATTSQEVLGAQWRAAQGLQAALNVFGQRPSIFGSQGVRRMADRYLA